MIKDGGGELLCQSNVANSSCSTRFTREKTAEMAGRNFNVSEVHTWLSSISHGLNLERLAPEFERRGFQSMHSLKYIGQNDLEVIINYPDNLLLAERRILEKELKEIKNRLYSPRNVFHLHTLGLCKSIVPLTLLCSSARRGQGRLRAHPSCRKPWINKAR